MEQQETRRLTRKEKRQLRQQGKEQPNYQEKLNFKLRHFDPLTQNQKHAFDSFKNEKNLMLHGIAGTGNHLWQCICRLNKFLVIRNLPIKE